MKTSRQGIVALICHEGIVPAPYLDSQGYWTFGIGHAETSALPPDPAHMPRAYPSNVHAALQEVFRVFLADLPKYESDVLKAVKVPLSQHQFDALVSWHFNTGAVGKASLIKALNAGDYAAAGRGLMNWTKNKELIPRRKDEQKLFLTGEYPRGRATVWLTDGKGKVIWKPKAVLTESEVFAYLQGAISKTVTTYHQNDDGLSPKLGQAIPEKVTGAKPLPKRGFWGILAKIFGNSR